MLRKAFRSSLRHAAYAALMVAACGSLAVAQTKTKLKIAFPTSPHAFALPHFIATELGWLAEKGVEIEEQWIIGDTTVIRLIVAGDADMSVTGMPAAFAAVAAGAPIKAIGSQQVIFDFQMIAVKSITKIEDLVGKRFAAGPPLSIQTEVPRVIMRKHGVDPEKVNFIQAGGTPERLKAIAAGQAEASLIGTVFALQAVKNPNIHILTTVPKEFPGFGFSYFVVTNRMLADPAKRAALQVYVDQAIVRASRYLVDNQDEAVKILLKRVPSLDPDIAKAAVTELTRDKVWGINGGTERATMEFTAKFAVESKMIDKAVTYEQVVDPSLVESALSRMGRR